MNTNILNGAGKYEHKHNQCLSSVAWRQHLTTPQTSLTLFLESVTFHAPPALRQLKILFPHILLPIRIRKQTVTLTTRHWDASTRICTTTPHCTGEMNTADSSFNLHQQQQYNTQRK